MNLIDKKDQIASSFLRDIKLGKRIDNFNMFSSLYTGTSYKKFITFYENDIRTFALPLPSLYLFFVKNLSQIYGIQMILVRDGMISLLNFFLRFPNPKNFTGHLVVNSQFRDLIPSDWQGCILFYHFSFEETQETNKLNIFGHFSDSNLCEGSKELVLSRTRGMKTFVFMPAKKDIYLANNKSESADYEFIIDINKQAAESSFFKSWSEYLLNTGAGDNFLNIDIYSKLNSFSYYEQILLAKGGSPSVGLKDSTLNIIESFKMSKYHTLMISSGASDQLYKKFQRYHKILDIPDNKVTDSFLSVVNNELLPDVAKAKFYEA